MKTIGRGIRSPVIDINEENSMFKAYVTGKHPDFIRAWDGWSGFCRHTTKGQPRRGFETFDACLEFVNEKFPTNDSFFEYAGECPSTRLSDARADDFSCNIVHTIFFPRKDGER
jgi:hypothetical protein